MASEEDFVGLGFDFNVNRYEYYKPSVFQTHQSTGIEGVVYSGIIELDMTVIEHSRSIYTFWDFLGDVGGLFGMLQSFAFPLVGFCSLLLNTGLEQYLITSLFKV